ncbi:MAG TPA: TetR family transcriptional regulator [Trueperaceae bacterium]|nr:TetR family transcriptional regulator [Trueperaceae bacterium]
MPDTVGSGPRQARTSDSDKTARARIRDAAIKRFARDGVAATSVKAIAKDARVSAPLVIHHFGSKEGLRAECDRYVNQLTWEMKSRLDSNLSTDPLSSIRQAQTDLPILEYIARTIPDGSEHADSLVDSMVEDTLRYMAAAEADGLVRPVENRRERAIVLVLWQLGALVLHEQAKRLLGADLTGPSAATIRFWLPAGEILANGVLNPERFEEIRAASLAALAKEEGE